MQKINLLFIILFFSVFSAKAQIAFGVKGGANRTHINQYTEDAHIPKLPRESRHGFNLDLFAEYLFRNNLGLDLSLGLATNSTAYIEEDKFMKLTYTETRNNLRAPLRLFYRFHINPEMSIKVSAGFYAAYAISGRKKAPIFNEYKIDEDLFYNKKGKGQPSEFPPREDRGFTLAVAFEYQNFLLELEKNRGLSNLSAQKEHERLHSRSLSLKLGYRL